MEEDEESPLEVPTPAQGCSPTTFDFDSFSNFMIKVVIEPFGGRLFQPILELATELDLPDDLMDLLKMKGQSQGGSLRKNLRKPTTPAKIMKTSATGPALATKTFETKE